MSSPKRYVRDKLLDLGFNPAKDRGAEIVEDTEIVEDWNGRPKAAALA